MEILPQGNLVEIKTEIGGDQQVGDDGEAVGWDRVADGNHRTSPYPSAAKRRAKAFPIPEVAPVTSAVGKDPSYRSVEGFDYSWKS